MGPPELGPRQIEFSGPRFNVSVFRPAFIIGRSYVKLSTSVTQFNFPTTKRTVVQKPVLRGNRHMTGCGIKIVQRLLTCFVGRRDKDTTEDELRDYQTSVGIHDATCKQLESKDGRVFRTAAFRVSCKAEFRVLFYNEDTNQLK